MSMERQLSQRKQVKSALERIQFIEEELPRIVMGVNEALTGANQQQQRLAAIIEAMAELVGNDAVDAKIKEISERKALQRLEDAKKALDAGLVSGDIVKADVVGEKSLLVGRETDTEGKDVFPGRVQLTFAGIKPEFQEKLKGQGVGTQIDTGTGKFEVLEVYDVIEKQVFDPPVPTEVEAQPVPVETPAQLDAALSPQAEA